jgi:hypothetical protein
MPQVTEVRERIVNAAEECLARYGAGRTTIEDLCAGHLRPRLGAAPREGTLRPDITVDDAGEFFFRVISPMIVMPREDEPREFLRTYVIPVLAEST